MNRQVPPLTAFCARLMTLLALLLATPAMAQLPQPGRNAIKAELVAETSRPAAGGTVTLAIVMTPDPGWHGYWQNPGDAGVEARIDWSLPEGARIEPVRYPVPEQLVIAGLMNYVYEGRYAKLADLKLPAGLTPGTRVPVRASLDYLACTDEICVPERADVATDLVIGDGPAKSSAAFDAYRRALPRPLGSDGRYEFVGESFRMAVPVPAAMAVPSAYFYPLTDGAIDYAAPQRVSRNGDILVIEGKIGRRAAGINSIEGVLAIGDAGLQLTARPGTVPAAGEALAPEASGVAFATILAALGGALLGGLILNIMPCVFPILSLKALSLARAGGDEGAVRREALAYAAGCVIVCLALGGVLLGLRAGGAAAGWAFQLQDPRVILILLLLVIAIALNLSGLFALPSIGAGGELAQRGGAGGAFWTGALAAFIATPCTGPFMGAALGAALVLPAAAALAVFGGLGLGLALPFLLLGFVPALRRRLPRPGPWMERFQRILAVPMFLTALALAWVLGRQAGVDGMAIGLGAALILALALWWTGRRQGRGRAWLPLAPAFAAALAAVVLIPGVAAPAEARSEGAFAAEPFSEARLQQLRDQGRPVFVYFTADWCITCKVNEKGALERAEVVQSFARRDIAVLVGDWTRGDAEIGRFLAAHGRSGVPLYLYYAPGAEPRTLPQVLTVGELTSLG